jgi:lipopolysaccharide transport system permease protein
MIQIVNSVMNVLFLVTPIMWQIDRVPEAWRAYFFINPLAAFLEIFRNPLLGLPINQVASISVITWTSLSIGLLFFLYYRFENRIIYWI